MPARNFQNLVDMFESSVRSHGSRELFGTKTHGAWVWTTYAEVKTRVDAFRAGLSARGIRSGDRVCILSNNRVEWAVAAYACFGLGASIVPMYEAQLSKEWVYIANDCSAVAFIVSTQALYDQCNALREKIPSVTQVIAFSLPKTHPDSYEAVLALGESAPVPVAEVTSKDTACVIYTSGTTGTPKGVILSHGNIISNVNAIEGMFPITCEDRSLSFLPWAHVFGHTCELHVVISYGASMALCESTDKIIHNLAEVRPTILFSVPRIFNKIYDGVNRQLATKPKLLQRLFGAGVRAASRRSDGKALGLSERIAIGLADSLIFSTIRKKFGGQLKFVICGGAALSRDVAQFIDSLGIVVYQGYGLTETSPLVSVNCPSSQRIGSVGKPIAGVRAVIDKSKGDDPRHGEIVIYGGNVMMGYYNQPREAQEVFTEDGGFRTGDLGYLDDDGYLYITGRLKEQYKLENGKYIAPAPLEEQIKLSPYIGNVMIYGDNRDYNVALVVPEFDAVKKWGEGQGISFESHEAIANDSRVKELLQAEINKISASFKGFERIQRIALCAEDFTLDNSMLTPSLKVKRRAVWAKYGPVIEALYHGATEHGCGGNDTPSAAA